MKAHHRQARIALARTKTGMCGSTAAAKNRVTHRMQRCVECELLVVALWKCCHKFMKNELEEEEEDKEGEEDDDDKGCKICLQKKVCDFSMHSSYWYGLRNPYSFDRKGMSDMQIQYERLYFETNFRTVNHV